MRQAAHTLIREHSSRSTMKCSCNQHRPLCRECSRINVRFSVGSSDITSVDIPFSDAFWSDWTDCKGWTINVAKSVRADSFWRVYVYIMGHRVDRINYLLYPKRAKLPDHIHIKYSEGVTLVGRFRWCEVREDHTVKMSKYFRRNVDIFASPKKHKKARVCKRVLSRLWIDLIQVSLSPTFFEKRCKESV